MPKFKDRRTGLIIFGILQILLGLAALGMVALMGLSLATLSLQREQLAGMGMEMRDPKAGLLMAIAIYLAAAVWFVWMGIGSILCRRWARALTLITSWLWFIMGVVAVVSMALITPAMREMMAQFGQLEGATLDFVVLFTWAIVAVIYVVIPGGLIVFYRLESVKLTCERRDKKKRWTDKCPLEVLTLSVLCVFFVAATVTAGSYGWMVMLFGRLIVGWAGALFYLTNGAVLLWLAWALYKLDARGYWGAVVYSVLAFAAGAGNLIKGIDWQAFYGAMGYSRQEILMTQPMLDAIAPHFAWMFLLIIVPTVWYMWRIKRHFQ